MNITGKLPVLAVTFGLGNPKNNGLIVTVLRPWCGEKMPNGSRWDNSSGEHCWVVECHAGRFGSENILHKISPIHDSRLRQISGGDDLINTDTTEPINAEVKV